MTGRYLLDTNVVIALLGQEAAVRERLGQAAEVFIPSIVLGELYFGAMKSERSRHNVSRIDELAAAAAILGCDQDTAREYGQIKCFLRGKGRPIPENDLWVAAVAKQHALTLVSRDEHFAGLEGPDWERW